MNNKITIKDNEAFLRQVSLPIDIANDSNLINDIAVLDNFCNENEVMAISAVQLGIPKRLIYLKNTNLDIINKIQSNSTNNEEQNYNESRVLINPVILKREGLTEYWESCVSCLDNCGLVYRPYRIKIRYYDMKGQKHLDFFEGFESTVLSHELDHLDGILHLDIAEIIIKMSSDERKAWRQKNNYKIHYKEKNYDLLLEEIKNNKLNIKTN